ncbi:MAG: caspase family protein, partial [Haloferacaceae archaeon]
MKKVRFVDTDRGVRAVDDIEDRTFQFHLPDGSTVDSIPADRFTFPVTAAVEVGASRVLVPEFFGLFVYDRDEGEFVRTVEPATEASISPGTYDVDLSNAPLKIYVSFEGALEVSRSPEGTVLEFDGDGSIELGARSLHSRPAGTITTTGSVEDLMYAVSSFGSAMKTFSPERSFPTLRGHPPRLEVGEERAAPAGIEPPDTGVEIAVPPDVRSVYTVASLSYYLGARIVPGDDPAILAGGDRFPLVGEAAPRNADSLIDGAAAALERQFALDCAVRTAGIYDARLREAERLKRRADLDLDRLYGLPLADRIGAYFEVPGHVADGLLEWHSTTDVMPSLRYATYLPYVVAELSHVRSYDPSDADAELAASPTDMGDFFRSTASDPAPSAGVGTRSTAGDPVRSTDVSGRNPPEIDEVVTPPAVDTAAHVWLADRYPLRAGKPTLESLERRFGSDRAGMDSERIRVLVVCNEPEMRAESDGLYGFRDYFEFDIDVRQDLSTAELRETLREEFDFFHYVGHVDERGMRCHDGWLDLRDLDDTGVELFFLNACTSFHQGRALVDAGSRGGVITLSEVYNSLATRFGRRLARLLDAGFDLYGALAAGRDSVIGGGMYGIVGDGRASLCHNTDGVPTLYHVEPVDRADPV